MVSSNTFCWVVRPAKSLSKYTKYYLLSPPFFPRRIPQCALHFHVFYHGWRRFVCHRRKLISLCENLVQCFFYEICHNLLFLPFHEQKPPGRHLRRFPQQVKTVPCKHGNPFILLLQVDMSPFNVKGRIG